MAINKTELATAFGTYISSNSREILKKILATTETAKYMTTKASQITEYRAAEASISCVIQGFQANWTPMGDSTFTPIVIQNRRHKVNVAINPDEVVDNWLGFLADETKLRKDWPITRYIIDELIVPKVLEDRELKVIGKGVYAAPVNGTAQETGKSVDGFLTILKTQALDKTSKVSFILTEALTETNVVDEVEKFVDKIDELYQNMNMPIFCSQKVYKMYKRRYRELYPTSKNDDKGNDQVDFSNNKLVALPSMAGSMVLFTTPKDNFIRLINRNEGASNIFLQEQDYTVKVFADWWEAPGFAVAEAVFATVPEGNAVLQLAADATTINSTAAGALRFFKTNTNTVATAITAITNAVEKQVIYIVGGGTGANATTIANAGNFVLNGDWTATPDSVLKVVKKADNKFYELGRY